VEEVTLGKAAAAAPEGDSWVPVCRPEDLPKGEWGLRGTFMLVVAEEGFCKGS